MAVDPGSESMRTQISKVLDSYQPILTGFAEQSPQERRRKGWSTLLATPGAQAGFAYGMFKRSDGSIMIAGARPVVGGGLGLNLTATGDPRDFKVWNTADLAHEEDLLFVSGAFAALNAENAGELEWDQSAPDPPGSFRAFGSLCYLCPSVKDDPDDPTARLPLSMGRPLHGGSGGRQPPR